MERGITPVELIFVLFALAIGLSYLARRLHLIERDLDLEALRAGA